MGCAYALATPLKPAGDSHMEEKFSRWGTNAALVAGFLIPAYLSESESLELLHFAALALWPATWAALFFKWMYDRENAQIERTQKALDLARRDSM